jgi:hypothetical protein
MMAPCCIVHFLKTMFYGNADTTILGLQATFMR